MIENVKKLTTWQKSVVLVKAIYACTSVFPKEEIYGLTSQMRRAAVSIPSNLADGHSRHTTKEYLRYVRVAYGSLAELETQCYLAQELGFLKPDAYKEIVLSSAELGRMMNSLMQSLQKKVKERALCSPLSALSEQTA